MIAGQCTTTDNNLVNEEWPEYFNENVKREDWVQAKSGKLAIIDTIMHTYGFTFGLDNRKVPIVMFGIKSLGDYDEND